MRRGEAGAGLDPELRDEQGAGRGVRLQGLGLSIGAVERQHQQRPQPLAQRELLDQAAELGDRLGVPAGLHVQAHPPLEGGDVPLGEVPAGDVDRLTGETAERFAAPQRQGGGRVSGREALEGGDVHLRRLDPQPVAGFGGDEVAAEIQRLAQPAHVRLHQVCHARRGLGAPHGRHDPVDRHRPARLQQQDGQHGLLLDTAEGDLGVAAPRAQRAEQLETQRAGHGRDYSEIRAEFERARLLSRACKFLFTCMFSRPW